ncbi:MAG: beta-glucosidase [Parachlamydia sp.]|nr:beta-glucosidase [Parachlamydia sp.]
MNLDPNSAKLPLLGVSTAAYQVEGAWNVDGKGVSVWDHFTHTRGMENGDIACDDYHRIPETVRALKELGVNVYRFSIAWTRILPDGVGPVNHQGITYYRHLIAELKNAGIAPMVTLYHWDLPQDLEEKGGWANRETVQHYVEYAKILFREFGDTIGYWITHNEPRVVSTRGYGSETMAPGLNQPGMIAIVNHHLLLSHGLAVQAFRERQLKGKIGISLNLKPVYCLEGGSHAAAAAIDREKNAAYLDPILKGVYPELPPNSFIQEGDMALISQPIDFLGINYYSREVVAPTKSAPKAVNCLGWKTYPEGLHDLLVDLKSKYPALPPLIVTENGFADHLEVSSDSTLHDSDRADYIKKHVFAVLQAKSKGVNVIGYVVWSLLDNLEWSFGYKPRFGLIHVDFKTLKRTPKESYYAYQQLVKQVLLPEKPQTATQG